MCIASEKLFSYEHTQVGINHRQIGFVWHFGMGGVVEKNLKETLKGYCCQRKVIVPASMNSKDLHEDYEIAVET